MRTSWTNWELLIQKALKIGFYLRNFEMYWNLTTNMWRKQDRDFSQIWQKSRTSLDININKLFIWKNILSIIDNNAQILINYVKERLNYLSYLYRKLHYNIFLHKKRWL